MKEASQPLALRVVVAGTSFGRVYVDAVRSAQGRFVLAGILARGSDYSREYAERQGVSLFTTVDEIPDDVDVACVVVSSGANGGPGAELAQALLRRGIHVLQEHPVHATELAACIRAARAGRAVYAVNTLYPYLAPVRRFLAAAEVLRRRQRLLFVDAACNSQVAYPLLDIIGRAVGGLRPWGFGDCQPVDAKLASLAKTTQPYQSMHAVIGGLPVTLRVQNQVHPEDPDNHSLLLHRISIGCEAGVLTLADTHGPVLWNPRMHASREGSGRLVMGGGRSDRLDIPSTSILGPEGMSTYREVFSRLWPQAVQVALNELAENVNQPKQQNHSGQWALGVTCAWAELAGTLGLPELIRPADPQPLALAELTAVALAVR